MRISHIWKSAFGIGMALGAIAATLALETKPARAEIDGAICLNMPPDEDSTVKTACTAVLLPCMLAGDGVEAEKACLRKALPLALKDMRGLRSESFGSAPMTGRRAELHEKCGHSMNADVVLSTCTELLKMPGNNEDTIEASLGNRGTAYMKKNKFQPCVDDLTEALKHSPPDSDVPDILKVRGTCLARLNEYELGKADFDRAVEINPNDPVALYDRGLLEKYRLGQTAQGDEDLRKAREIDPNVN
jgi:tetratricopeptide (TPR) repeat protein